MTKMPHARRHSQPRADVDAVAERRYACIIASGKAIAWSDMRIYLQNAHVS
ncbi:hypothetical protein KHF85_05265 [Xanthomonas translucens pv. graminis]|uniref:hypothetical protein n=1 Tax=Xanthomonas graminis TaxID=3390026 RepID=UPI00254151AD|nr:hypothetical protein [Xanthomonas translucens]WIH07047.1 hypothetical protein KHF85_05265 [Xanthomonas translucens pv. graminis]